VRKRASWRGSEGDERTLDGLLRPDSGEADLPRWVVLCAGAEVIGMTAAAGAARIGQTWTGAEQSPREVAAALAVLTAGGVVEGLAVGVAQAIGLGGRLGRRWRRRWIGVTVLIAGVGWAAASAPGVLASEESGGEPPKLFVLAGATALGAGMGVLLGLAQSTVLRRSGQVRPWRWAAVSTAAWATAMPIIFAGATWPDESWQTASVIGAGSLTGLVAGAALGAVTAVGTRRAWEHSERQPASVTQRAPAGPLR
jgi:hypothetical protein